MDSESRARRLREARQARGFKTAIAAADAFGWNRNTYSSNENGNAPFSYRRAKAYAEAFGVDAVRLYEGREAEELAARSSPAPLHPDGVLVPVIGLVGADPEGRVLFATGQAAGDLVPIPPGGSEKTVALQVVGGSMRGLADDGSLVYFEDQRTPPSPDMLGHVVVVETDGDEVLVKRIFQAQTPGRFDLESLDAPTRRNCKIRWAAHITAIIPPHQARRIIRSGA